MTFIAPSIIGNGGYIPPATSPAVPDQDSTDNVTTTDVVGNKTDTHDGDSLAAGLHTLKEHIHKPSKVYPTLADGVTLTATSGAGTWTPGTITQIVPASTITDDFDIHFVIIEDISANGVFELIMYAGDPDVEVGRTRFVRSSNFVETLAIPVQTPIIAANSRIRGQIATNDDAGQTATLSVEYHLY